MLTGAMLVDYSARASVAGRRSAFAAATLMTAG